MEDGSMVSVFDVWDFCLLGMVKHLPSRESGADRAELPMPPQPLPRATSLQGLLG